MSRFGVDVSVVEGEAGLLPRSEPEAGELLAEVSQARELGINVTTATKPVPHTARGWLHGVGNEGLINLVVDTERNVLIGATSAGPHGGEVLGLLALAVHAAIPIPTLRSMIYAYPTFHKGIEDALDELDQETPGPAADGHRRRAPARMDGWERPQPSRHGSC